MNLYSQNDSYELYHGNMLDMLGVIENNSIDSIVTDPPYGLTSITKRFGKENSAECQYGKDGSFARLSRGFMGKEWDGSGIEYNVDTWQKCYEVLKPGGYLLAFGGSRTFHRIACAIEDAGFEIRDTIMWIYGSGFPKSMDISKSLDKRNGRVNNDFIEFGKFLKEKRGNISQTEIRKLFPSKNGNPTGNVSNWELGKNVPTMEQYKILKEKLELDNRFDWLIKREEAEREVIGKKESGCFNSQEKDRYTIGSSKSLEVDMTLPSTDLAKQWQGWGTALKPSFEPIIVARKPFKGSLVDNVIKNGVGGINIDECRVENNGEKIAVAKDFQDINYSSQFGDENFRFKQANTELKAQGRFPANTILTYDESDFDEVCGGFPYTKCGARKKQPYDANKNLWNKMGGGDCEGSEGSASRYFYCAKASKKDRDEGLDTFNQEKVNDGRNTPIDNAFQRGETLRKNTHPTVKPTSLMQYLVRLVTPNGGTILDPFNGSGSTGKAVMYENKERNKNYKYIGIELTEEYLPIAKARIEHVCKLTKEEKDKERQMSIYEI